MKDPLELDQPDLLHIRLDASGAAVVDGPATRLIGRPISHGRDEARPDGTWVRWAWDGRKLTITNDRFGYVPLYYAANEREICISPSLIDVVRKTGRRAWDPAALGVFLRYGYYMGDETPFRDVRLVAPNSTTTWEAGTLTVVIDPFLSRRTENLGRAAVVDAVIELVRAAVGRRLPRDGEHAWVPLSGGRDSRHILLALHRAGVRPRAITIKYRPPGIPQDAEIASQVCRVLGADIDIVDSPDNWFASERRKNRLIGFASPAHHWFIPIAERMTGVGREGFPHRAASGGIAYDGITGDILTAGYFLDAPVMERYERGQFEEIARGWINQSAEKHLNRLLSDRAGALMPLDAAIARVVAELKRYADQGIPINSYMIRVRQRRAVVVTQYGYLRRLNAVLSPYLDRDIYDFIQALPWHVLSDKRVHDDALAKTFPQYAKIGYAVRGASTKVGSPPVFRRLGRQIIAYSLLGRGSRLMRQAFHAASVSRAWISGDHVSTQPLLLLQLEREAGLEVV